MIHYLFNDEYKVKWKTIIALDWSSWKNPSVNSLFVRERNLRNKCKRDQKHLLKTSVVYIILLDCKLIFLVIYKLLINWLIYMMHLWPIFRAMRSADESYRIYAYLIEKNHVLEKIKMETVLYKFYMCSIEPCFSWFTFYLYVGNKCLMFIDFFFIIVGYYYNKVSLYSL